MLRKLLEKDAEKMYLTLTDHEINHHMRIGDASFTLEGCKKFILSSNNDKHNVHFAIVDSDDNWVGTISLKDIDYDKKQAEYAIITCKEVHGKGYAPKATDEILEYGFNKLGLEHIYLDVISKNEPAKKFYQKYGFKHDRTDINGITIGGELCDLEWYYMDRKDFKR